MTGRSQMSVPRAAAQGLFMMASVASLAQAGAISSSTLVQRNEGTGREQFGTLPYGSNIWACNKDKTVALTFDDGPSKLTGELLDLLEEKNVKATFFVIGTHDEGDIDDNSTDKPDLLKRMMNAGHQIGSHGWSHEDLNAADEKLKREEIMKADKAIASVLGVSPTYFRPPYGRCNEECNKMLADYGYHTIQWDTDTDDWKKNMKSSKARYSDAVSKQNSALVLAHDIHEPTVRELTEFMIDEAISNGHKLVTVGECMGDPTENWYRDAGSGGPGQAQSQVLSEDSKTSTKKEDSETTKDSADEIDEDEDDDDTKTSSRTTAPDQVTLPSTDIDSETSIQRDTSTPSTASLTTPTSDPTASQTSDDDDEDGDGNGSSADGQNGGDDEDESGAGILRPLTSGSLGAVSLSVFVLGLLGRLI